MSKAAQKERRPGAGTPRRPQSVKHWLVDAFILPRTACGVKRMLLRTGEMLVYILGALLMTGWAVEAVCR